MESRKIVEYTVVTEDDIYIIIERVGELLKEGYQPLGSPQTCTEFQRGESLVWFYQAMIKYEEQTNGK